MKQIALNNCFVLYIDKDSLVLLIFLGFLLDLQKVGKETSKQPDASMLLALTDKIHLALIKTDPSGDSHLLGSHYLEWRGILCSPNGKIRNSIEINGVGAEAKVPIGIVDIRLDMIPRLQHVCKSLHFFCQMKPIVFLCQLINLCGKLFWHQ